MASSDSQQAVSEQPTLLSHMDEALAVVDVNHVHGRRGSQNGDNERAKKRLKSQEPAEVSVSLQVPSPEPMSVEELVECCQENNIPYEVPRMALRQQTYQILYLRGKRKPRRHSLVLFQPNDGSDPNRPRRDIKEWSTLLKYKHTGRLSD